MNLETPAKNTWCPGCTNFALLSAFKEAIKELIKKGIPKEKFVITSGIGCHGKIVDWLNLNSFYSLHGRPIATAEGIKIANCQLKVIAFSGDGDAYDEGISHLIHSAKRNIDITVIVHNNRTFALTVNQFTATSPFGYQGSSTPSGSIEKPLNPLFLVFSSGGTFIARGYALKIDHLKNLIVSAISHKGFSFIDVLQPCIAFFDLRSFYEKRIYELKKGKRESKKWALSKILEWDYNTKEGKIPIGIFYQKKAKPFRGLTSDKSSGV